MSGVLDDEPYEMYTGEKPAEWLLKRLIDYEERCTKFLFDETRIRMTAADEIDFANARFCYICEKSFSPTDVQRAHKGQSKVRDHDHISGEYRGAAHSYCNLLKRRQRKIPIFFHNLRGYDEHIIVPALGQHKDRKLRIIGQTMEKYLQIEFGDHLVFKDSLQFLSCSLSELGENLLAIGRDKFTHTLRGFQGEPNVDLLLRKGIYPYDYMSSANRLKETNLPPREAFDSKLRWEKCSAEDYEHAQRVWQAFRCKTFEDYHDLYLKCDVLILADVFESFRTTAMQTYGVDPAHYVSAPHLSWDSMQRMTRCKLDLLSDSAMFQVLQENLRGGVAMISKRYAEANNKYMDDLYDPSKPSKYIIYLDANNLYGWSMSEPLPTGDFAWLDADEIRGIDWLTQVAEQEYGYFVECDLEYPAELHDLHSDYPLAPQRLEITMEMLSEKQLEHRAAYDMPNVCKSTKLVPNLMDKVAYMCHYRCLRFYLEHGMKLKQVRRVIRFRQSRWLEPYISKNSQLRAQAKNKFEKDFFKLLNNSVFGKTCENVLKRQDIRLVTDAAVCKELISKPHCTGFKVFNEDIAAVAMQKLASAIDKPMYVGFAVLELSKLCMYRFHYDWTLKTYALGKANLLFTDTDSLVYEIETDDIYEDIRNDPAAAAYFDMSNYPQTSRFYSCTNKGIVGKMKDESEGKIITQVAAVRPKMYSYLTLGSADENGNRTLKEAKRAKGIQKAAVKDITHAAYVAQILQPKENYVRVRRIEQRRHQLRTIEQDKRGICAYDDKRYLLPNGIDTLAHGHYKIQSDRKEAAGRIASAAQDAQAIVPVRDEDGSEVLVVSHAAVIQSAVLTKIFHLPTAPEDDEEVQEAAAAPKVERAPKLEKRSFFHMPVNRSALANVREKITNKHGFKQEDFDAAQLAIAKARFGIAAFAGTGEQAVENLKRELHNDNSQTAQLALQLLDASRGSCKTVELSPAERLFLVATMDAPAFREVGRTNERKLLFMILTGRSAGWWKKNHATALQRLAARI